MARIITFTEREKEYYTTCLSCEADIAYTKADIQEKYADGFREPELVKSWIVCPGCSKKIFLSHH